MRRSLLHIIVISVCLWPAGSLLAQGRQRAGDAVKVPVPVLKATVDKQKILIGEPIHLMLEATVFGDGEVSWPVLDTLAHFEFVEKHAVDSTPSAGSRYYRQYLTVTSFDSGSWAIPRLPFVVGNKKFFTDSVRIEIGYTKIDPTKDYHDIKDIIEVPNPFARWFGWIVALGAVGSVAVVVWLVRKKKLLQVLIPGLAAPRLSPFEEAIRQLDELARQRLVENGSVKVFYSRLSDILRVYLFRRQGIASLSETSDELLGQIRKLSLSSQQLADLSETLRMGDFVKFAKFQPGVADSEFHYKVIRESIGEFNRKAEEEEKKEITA